VGVFVAGRSVLESGSRAFAASGDDTRLLAAESSPTKLLEKTRELVRTSGRSSCDHDRQETVFMALHGLMLP
jgi:hypothetical protein